MTLKALQLDIGVLNPTQYRTGWYRDPSTGQYYWYNGESETWYIHSAGVLYPTIWIPDNPWLPSPSPILDVWTGDIVEIYLTFRYKGPRILVGARDIYAEVVNNDKSGSIPGAWLDFNGRKGIYVPECINWTTITSQYAILFIPPEYTLIEHTGEIGAIYVKMLDGGAEAGKNCSPFYYDAIRVIPVAGAFENFAITNIEKQG